MALGDGKIGRVVRRGYLEDARAEGHVDLLVADDGDSTLLLRKFGGKRTEGKLTDEGGVARVFGIYGDGGISRNRFGSGGRDGEEDGFWYERKNRGDDGAGLQPNHKFLETSCGEGY